MQKWVLLEVQAYFLVNSYFAKKEKILNPLMYNVTKWPDTF